MDTLTPLDARNSLLLDRTTPGGEKSMFSVPSTMDVKVDPRSTSPDQYHDVEEGLRPETGLSGGSHYRSLTPSGGGEARQSLIKGAAPVSTYGGGYDQPPPYGSGGGYRGF